MTPYVTQSPIPESADALRAVAELIDKSGGVFSWGHLSDDPDNPEWWAQAEWSSAEGPMRSIVDGHADLAACADALATRVIEGGVCFACRLTMHPSPFGEAGFGRPRSTTRSCLWARVGDEWKPGCHLKLSPPTATIDATSSEWPRRCPTVPCDPPADETYYTHNPKETPT